MKRPDLDKLVEELRRYPAAADAVAHAERLKSQLEAIDVEPFIAALVAQGADERLSRSLYEDLVRRVRLGDTNPRSARLWREQLETLANTTRDPPLVLEALLEVESTLDQLRSAERAVRNQLNAFNKVKSER